MAFIGIDGSGKSSHAAATRAWLEARGYKSELVPFHRYLLVDSISRAMPARGRPHRSRRGNALRPVFSLLDNLLFLVSTSAGRGMAGEAVVYDRFIWSTYIKYAGLGYPVRPISYMYLLPRPKAAILFDVPIERSLHVIDEREIHIKYARNVLAAERERYLRLARERGYPIIDSTGTFEVVQGRVEALLSPIFPPASRRAS